MPSSGRGCGRISIAGPPFEELVISAVFEAMESPQLARAIQAASSNGRDAELVKVITQGRRALEGLDDDYFDGRMDRARWERQTSRITERIERAQRQLGQTSRSRVLSDLPHVRDQLERVWNEREVAWRSELLGAVVERVIVNPPKKSGRFDPERFRIVWRA
jgi:hypothetical protein